MENGNGNASKKINDLEVKPLHCASCSTQVGYILLQEDEIEYGVFCMKCMDDEDLKELFDDE